MTLYTNTQGFLLKEHAFSPVFNNSSYFLSARSETMIQPWMHNLISDDCIHCEDLWDTVKHEWFSCLWDAVDKLTNSIQNCIVISVSIILKNGWELGVTLTVHALWFHNLLLGTCNCTIAPLWLSLRVTMGNAKQKYYLENRS